MWRAQPYPLGQWCDPLTGYAAGDLADVKSSWPWPLSGRQSSYVTAHNWDRTLSHPGAGFSDTLNVESTQNTAKSTKHTLLAQLELPHFLLFFVIIKVIISRLLNKALYQPPCFELYICYLVYYLQQFSMMQLSKRLHNLPRGLARKWQVYLVFKYCTQQQFICGDQISPDTRHATNPISWQNAYKPT